MFLLQVKNFMKKTPLLYFITFILAFCSIVYELILAQSLSAFLENTVLRYSITIGLYMFSMGLGALIAEGKRVKHPVLTLSWVEISLTLLGGFSLVWLYITYILTASRLAFVVFAHSLVVAIGVLTGFEIPLLFAISKRRGQEKENVILAVDYAGAFFGTIIFAFVFYRGMGLMATAFLVGCLNSMAGIMLITQRKYVAIEKKTFCDRQTFIHLCLFGVVIICLVFADQVNIFFLKQYLR